MLSFQLSYFTEPLADFKATVRRTSVIRRPSEDSITFFRKPSLKRKASCSGPGPRRRSLFKQDSMMSLSGFSAPRRPSLYHQGSKASLGGYRSLFKRESTMSFSNGNFASRKPSLHRQASKMQDIMESDSHPKAPRPLRRGSTAMSFHIPGFLDYMPPVSIEEEATEEV